MAFASLFLEYCTKPLNICPFPFLSDTSFASENFTQINQVAQRWGAAIELLRFVPADEIGMEPAGETPAGIPPAGPRKTNTYLNSRTARRLGVKLPPAIVGEAAAVFGD